MKNNQPRPLTEKELADIQDMRGMTLEEMAKAQGNAARNTTQEERMALEAQMGYPSQNSEEAKRWNRRIKEAGL